MSYSVLIVKALVGTFNQEKALVGAFTVIVKTGCGTDGELQTVVHSTNPQSSPPDWNQLEMPLKYLKMKDANFSGIKTPSIKVYVNVRAWFHFDSKFRRIFTLLRYFLRYKDGKWYVTDIKQWGTEFEKNLNTFKIENVFICCLVYLVMGEMKMTPESYIAWKILK